MESSELDIKKYLRLAHKKRHILVIVAFLIITASVASGYLMPATYEAKCTVFIERNVIENLIKDIAITPSMRDRLEVLAYALKSRSLLLKVMDDLNVDIDREDQPRMEEFVRGLQEKTEIKTDNRSNADMNLFTISFRDGNPRFARDYVNTLVRMYIEENISEKREEAYGANRFLSEQIRYFEEKLDHMESEIVNFRKERGIFIAVNEAKVVDEIIKHQEDLENLKLEKKELEAKKRLVDEKIKSEDPYTVAMFGKKSSRMLNLQKKLNELMMKYTENYPEVLKVKAEIEALKAQDESVEKLEDMGDEEMSTLNPLYQQLKEELAKIGMALAALNAREENLNNLIESKKAYLREIPTEKKNLMELERERGTYERIYEQLVHRLGQSEVSKQMEVQDKAATFRVVDPAVLPTKPISPDRLKIILLGLFGGLAGGFGTVLGLDFMDKSVKTVESLRTLGLPVLAVVPHIQEPDETRKRKKKDILLYSFSALYLLCVLGIAALEKMNLIP